MVHDFQSDIDAVQSIAAVPAILDIICATTGMGFAAVGRVTEDRWVACSVLDNVQFGLQPGSELKVETTICHEIRQHRQPVIIDNVSDDETYRNHHTPAAYGLQSYISVPIILPNGLFFGTLCAIDSKPNALKTANVANLFKLFAELIAFHLDALDRIARSEARLALEVETAALREEFIAVLGHDLRNPLASVGSGTSILLREPQTEKSMNVLAMMQQSLKRMAGLVDNVMDFARGRLGGGFTLNNEVTDGLLPVLQQVVSEMQATWPERTFDVKLNITSAVKCDTSRIAQLFSNLLGNAIAYGSTDMPIKVDARTNAETFSLSVGNSGEPIPGETAKRLFQPFFRADVRPSQQGLGLGLFIVSEIARAHGGSIRVASTQEETSFTFQMPLETS